MFEYQEQITARILSVCSTFIAAILGVAYPIILNTISRIGEKYSSKHLPILFSEEFLQRWLIIRVGNRHINITFFNAILYFTLLSVLFLILYNNIYVYLAVLTIITTFVIIFIIWANKVIKYSGNLQSIISFLIEEHNKYKDKDEEKSKKIIEALNEITLYAVKIGDDNLQEELLQFYYSIIDPILDKHNKTEPLEYPEFWYSLVNNICKIAARSSEELGCLDRLATKGYLLLDYKDNIIISYKTYHYLWLNVQIICNNHRLIRQFWVHSSEYFDYELEWINPDLEFEKRSEENQKRMERREEERLLFLEFHSALGGLLLYSKQYNSLNYIIHYSHRYPPQHILPPTTLFSTLQLISHFTGSNGQIHSVANMYSFVELDNSGNNLQIVDWICRYIAIAFLENNLQHLRDSKDLVKELSMPNQISELFGWLNCITYFDNALKYISQNKEWLISSTLNDIDDTDLKIINKLFEDIEYKIKSNIQLLRINSELSKNKVEKFYSRSNEIISNSFDDFRTLFSNSIDNNTHYFCEELSGLYAIFTKAEFIEDDIYYLELDSYLAKKIEKLIINKKIINSFFVAQTTQYLLSLDNIIKALDIITRNEEDVVIIGIDTDYFTKQLINESLYKTIFLSFESHLTSWSNSLFILRKSDLPVLEHCDLPEETIKELQLKCINPKLKLYASVIDINTEENKELKKKWNIENDDNPQVQLAIHFLAKMYWKKNREVIQIDVASEYKEQGILNSVSDVKPLSTPHNL